jgi:hypothetical protein
MAQGTSGKMLLVLCQRTRAWRYFYRVLELSAQAPGGFVDLTNSVGTGEPYAALPFYNEAVEFGHDNFAQGPRFALFGRSIVLSNLGRLREAQRDRHESEAAESSEERKKEETASVSGWIKSLHEDIGRLEKVRTTIYEPCLVI